MLESLRNGNWLTLERLRLWPLCVLAVSCIGALYVIFTANGLNDFRGRPIGSDFSNVYAAGTYVIEGRPAAPFDWPTQFAREQEIFGQATQFYGWHYPPSFLFVAAALATMPYLVALAVWQGVTLLLYLFSIRAILAFLPSPLRGGSRGEAAWGGGRSDVREDRSTPLPTASRSTSPARGEAKEATWLLPALAFPAVFVNIGHGHNGFLSAALIGAALVSLDKRPILAGILFGLVSYKPQFGVLIPLVLMASGRWRTFAAAAATVAVLMVVTMLVFGLDAWRAFFASLHLTRVEVLEAGSTGWQKIQSVFAWVRMWGGSVPLAYAVQGAITLAAAGALIWLWRSSAAFALKAAALAIGAILATPYSLDYDMMVLAPAMAFLAADGLARGFGPWEKSALALLWFVPMFARAVAEYTFIPIGVWAMLLVFVLALRRAAAEVSVVARGAPRPSA